MTMTRKQLKELGLPQETVERLIAMHADTVEGLKQERDAWQQAAGETEHLRQERDALQERVTALEDAERRCAEVQQAFDDYRTALEKQEKETACRQAVRQALLDRGANEAAVPLLMQAVPLDEARVEDGTLQDVDALLEGVCRDYGAFFAQPTYLGTERLAPPLESGTAITRETIQAMDTDEINRNWSAVKEALCQVRA